MLKRRIGQVVELCKQLRYPLVLAYGVAFDMELQPLQANLHGYSVVPGDISTLLETFQDAATEKLGQHLYQPTTIEDLPTDRQEAMGHMVFEDACSLRGG